MSNRKDATRFTEAANTAVLNELSWDDTQDFDFAGRGFVASLNEPIITDTNGRSVWELNGYPFLEEETAPPTRKPQLVAAISPACTPSRPVQSNRWRLSDSRL